MKRLLNKTWAKLTAFFLTLLFGTMAVLGGLGIGKLLLDERFAFFQDLIDPAEQKLAHEEIENQQIDDGKYEIDI